jgi:DNA-binding NarL/FixJ family response regulator
MTTVMVAAPSAHARSRLEAAVRGRASLTLLPGAPAGRLADALIESAPDVLVIDLPDGGPARLLRDLGTAPRAPAVVLLTGSPRGRLGAEALRAGLRAVLPRDASAAEIVAAVEAVAAGLVVVLHPDGLPALSPAGPLSRSTTALDEPLTARETEILAMLAEGYGNKTIAARLGISGHTVKFHVASILGKLGAGSRTEAVTLALRRGLIMI